MHYYPNGNGKRNLGKKQLKVPIVIGMHIEILDLRHNQIKPLRSWCLCG